MLAAVVGVAAGVVSDQAEADEEMSLKQRLVLAGGSTLAEGGGVVDELTGVSLAADVLEVAGMEFDRVKQSTTMMSNRVTECLMRQ